MKNLVKYAAVGIAGYLVGFYEMKYKTMKIILKAKIEEDKTNEEDKVEEAQPLLFAGVAKFTMIIMREWIAEDVFRRRAEGPIVHKRGTQSGRSQLIDGDIALMTTCGV